MLPQHLQSTYLIHPCLGTNPGSFTFVRFECATLQIATKNAALSKKMGSFKDELSTFKEFQAQSADIGTKLDMLASLQDEIASFKKEVL